MIAVLRHELWVGWRAPLGCAVALGLLALRLDRAPIAYASGDATRLALCGLAALCGLGLGLWRLEREAAAPGFLASRPVSGRRQLGAKLVAAMADALVVAPGVALVAYAVVGHTAAWFDGAVPAGVGVLAALAAVALRRRIESGWIVSAVGLAAAAALAHAGAETLGRLRVRHWDGRGFALDRLEAQLALVGVAVLVALALRREPGR